MRRRSRAIPRRRRVFVGCEGESERGYVKWLQRLLDQHRDDRHLEAVLLKPGAGDPLAMVELAIRRTTELERRAGERFLVRGLLLDSDRRDEAPGRRDAACRRAAEAKLRLIWQEPCHEALLLRHLPGCETLRPPTGGIDALLRRHWPEYAKPMAADRLATRLGAADLRRACRVEAELAAFLCDLGFNDVVP